MFLNRGYLLTNESDFRVLIFSPRAYSAKVVMDVQVRPHNCFAYYLGTVHIS